MVARLKRLRTLKTVSELRQLVKLFEKHKAITLGDYPDAARNRCHELSTAFQMFALGTGVWAEILRFEGVALSPTVAETKAEYDAGVIHAHYVVWFRSIKMAVDYTARQFWKKADHPFLMTMNDIKRYWHDDYLGEEK